LCVGPNQKKRRGGVRRGNQRVSENVGGQWGGQMGLVGGEVLWSMWGVGGLDDWTWMSSKGGWGMGGGSGSVTGGEGWGRKTGVRGWYFPKKVAIPVARRLYNTTWGGEGNESGDVMIRVA